MKIAIIGPSYPFRGGIAHYTTLLFKELAEYHNVRFFSFKRQYPAWLYPGKTDKDPSEQLIKDERVEPVLDSMNPFTWFSVFFMIKKLQADLVIIPWWVAFWAPQFGLITRLLKWFSNTKILFICHNVVEHEANWLSRALTSFVLKKGDFFIVHSEDDYKNLKQIMPKANIVKAHHPTYEIFGSGAIGKTEARKKLGISCGNIMLFFGFVRPYKGLKYLLEALALALREIEVKLLIVGEFWKDKAEYIELIEKFKVSDHIYMVDEYVPNEKINEYFAASDVVVLPYVLATGSGVVQTAYGCKRPVITTRVGSLSDVVKEGQTGYLVSPGSAEELSKAIVRFYKQDNEEIFSRNIDKFKNEFSWAALRGKIEQLVDS